MTYKTSITATATALAIALTTDIAMAGQYTATLGKTEAGYSMAVEINDLEIGGLHVSSLSFGAIDRHGRGADLSAGLALNYGDMLHFSLAASKDGSPREVELGFQAKAVDLETSYGFLDFELGMQDDQIAGSLSLTKAGLWGLHDATFLANVDDSNIGLSLSGKTNYGFNLKASAELTTKSAARNTLTLSISGNF